MKYYVVETERQQGASHYNENGNNTYVQITTTQPTTNLGYKAIDEGWLGTTNNVYECLHGSFDTLKDADDYIKNQRIFEHFTIDEDQSQDDEIIYTDQREWWDIEEWFYDAKNDFGITAETTDEEIEKIELTLQEENENSKIKLVGDLLVYLMNIRENLKY
jgi:hypothetical protein